MQRKFKCMAAAALVHPPGGHVRPGFLAGPEGHTMLSRFLNTGT